MIQGERTCTKHQNAEEKWSFGSGRGSVAHTFVLKNASEKYFEKQKEL